jgi:hypothetical protein
MGMVATCHWQGTTELCRVLLFQHHSFTTTSSLEAAQGPWVSTGSVAPVMEPSKGADTELAKSSDYMTLAVQGVGSSWQ